MRKEPKYYRNKWMEFTFAFHKPAIVLHCGETDDPRMMLHISLTILIPLIGIWFTGLSWWSLIWIPFFCITWGNLFIHLPIKYVSVTKEDDEGKPYGFYFYSESKIADSLTICNGKRGKSIAMPWQWDWIRTSKLKKDGTWEHETPGNYKDWYGEKQWEHLLFKEIHPYVYVCNNGEVQNVDAAISVEEREWRWIWFKFLPFPRLIRRSISVNFSNEVGESAGGYKGGTLGCGYDLRPDEEPWEALARMERECKFR